MGKSIVVSQSLSIQSRNEKSHSRINIQKEGGTFNPITGIFRRLSAQVLAFKFQLPDPAMLLQIDLPCPEDDSLLLKQPFLSLIAAILLGERYPPFRIDDPMPGKAHPGGRTTKGESDTASLPDETAQSRDLPVRGHLSAGDVLDDGPNFDKRG
jgi:hypothetical protein